MFWILLILWIFDVITFWKALGIWVLWLLVNTILYSLSGALLYSAIVTFFAGFLGV